MMQRFKSIYIKNKKKFVYFLFFILTFFLSYRIGSIISTINVGAKKLTSKELIFIGAPEYLVEPISNISFYYGMRSGVKLNVANVASPHSNLGSSCKINLFLSEDIQENRYIKDRFAKSIASNLFLIFNPPRVSLDKKNCQSCYAVDLLIKKNKIFISNSFPELSMVFSNWYVGKGLYAWCKLSLDKIVPVSHFPDTNIADTILHVDKNILFVDNLGKRLELKMEDILSSEKNFLIHKDDYSAAINIANNLCVSFLDKRDLFSRVIDAKKIDFKDYLNEDDSIIFATEYEVAQSMAPYHADKLDGVMLKWDFVVTGANRDACNDFLSFLFSNKESLEVLNKYKINIIEKQG